MSAGALVFARYAAPPNVLGFCGPDDPDELLGAAGAGDLRSLAELARQFEGAWPYLELIAGCNGIADPLDARVVDAYWVGNRLLERVPAGALVGSLDTRFSHRAGRLFGPVAGSVALGGVVHHSFHVFAVYPWLGLLRAGGAAEPLQVLDRCRIRWGRVVTVAGDVAVVRSRGLAFDGHRLALGAEQLETARAGTAPALAPGDLVSLHWDWVCDRISPAALSRLQRYTRRNLDAVNALPAPGPAVACA